MSCDFELPCSFTQAQNDDFDWTLNSGSTPTTNTGPDTDHTRADSSGYYMYIEGSDPRVRTSLPQYMRTVLFVSLGMSSRGCRVGLVIKPQLVTVWLFTVFSILIMRRDFHLLSWRVAGIALRCTYMQELRQAAWVVLMSTYASPGLTLAN